MLGIEKYMIYTCLYLDLGVLFDKVDISFFQWVSQVCRENKYVPLIKCRCLPSAFWYGGEACVCQTRIWLLCNSVISLFGLWVSVCVQSGKACPTLCDPVDCSFWGPLWDFPGKNTGVGCRFHLRVSSWPRDWIHISCVAGGFFTTKPLGKPCLVFI